MQPKSSRRQFVRNTAAASLTALLPKRVFSQGPTAQSVVVRPGVEIGVVRPELHGHFAEHLGSCIYGGLWVGKNSRIPNVDGYRKAAVDALQELGIPVLRWPGGCFADNYHWRDGIGPVDKRPKRVNMNWANALEDGSFGLHEFIGLCRLIGAEPYLVRQRGQRNAAGGARLGRVLQLPERHDALRRAHRQRRARAVQGPLLGHRERDVGLRRTHDAGVLRQHLPPILRTTCGRSAERTRS